jgi:hypothetical protein
MEEYNNTDWEWDENDIPTMDPIDLGELEELDFFEDNH